jgi:hypothetical protein
MTKRILQGQIGRSEQWPKARPEAATLWQRVKQACRLDRPDGTLALGRQCAGSAADRLSFAAAPTFAMMALLTGILGYALLGRARRVTAGRHGPDVPADERVPFGSLAEMDFQAMKRCPPILQAASTMNPATLVTPGLRRLAAR